MIELLLASCIGWANAARGSGYKLFPFTFRGKETSLTKPILLICMALSAYTIAQNIWLAVIFPLPLGLSWSWEGGTGRQMPYILSWFKPPFIPQNLHWRAWEFFHVFVYSLLFFMSV